MNFQFGVGSLVFADGIVSLSSSYEALQETLDCTNFAKISNTDLTLLTLIFKREDK